MTTFETLYDLPKSSLQRIATGEFSLHLDDKTEIQQITIPFSHYLMLEQNLIIAKARKKK
jgi:hypothetical protein